MARLYTSGFELNSTSSGVETSNFGGFTLATAIKRTGGYAMRIQNPAGTSGLEHRFASGNLDGPFFARVYLYVATRPNLSITVSQLGDNTGTRKAGITVEADGTLKLFGQSAQVGSASAVLNTGQWYRLELKYHNRAANTSIIEGYLDGVLFASTSTWTTEGAVQFWRVGTVGGAVTCDFYYDDLAINDGSGSAQTALPGAGSVVHMLPDAAGDGNTWLKSGGGAGTSTNYQDVDEVTPDDATTYLKRTSTTIKVDDYNCVGATAAGIGASDAVTLVQVGVRGGATNATVATTRDILLRLKSQASGTVLKSGASAVRLNTTGWTTHTTVAPQNYQLTSYTDPQAGGSWTPTLLNTMQIGMENQTSSTVEVRVSTLWALVEFVPNPGVTVPVSALSVASAVQAPTVTARQNVTVSPAALSLASSLPAPAVRLPKTVSVSALGLVSSLNSPSVTGKARVAPSPVTVASATQVPTPSSDANVSPAAQGLSASTQAPAVRLPRVVSASSLTAASSLGTPAIKTGTGQAPAALSAQLTVQAPTVSAVRNVTVSPGVLSVTAAAQASQVRLSVSISPAPGTLAGSVPAPTLTLGTSVSVSPLAVIASVPAPTVSAAAGVSVSVSSLSLTTTTQSPSVSGAARVSPAAQQISASAPSPSVSVAGGVTVMPGSLALSFSLSAPSLGVTVMPGAMTLTSSAQAPGVSAGATVGPGAVSLTAATPPPAVSGGATVTVSTRAIASSLPLPSVTSAVGATVSPGELTLSATHIAIDVSGTALVVVQSADLVASVPDPSLVVHSPPAAELLTIQEALFRELKFGPAIAGVVPGSHVRLDARPEAETGGPYPWVVFRRITSSEDNAVRLARERWEIEVLGNFADDALLQAASDAILDRFSAKHQTWGQFTADGDASTGTGLRMRAHHISTVELMDDALSEKSHLLIFRFTYVR